MMDQATTTQPGLTRKNAAVSDDTDAGCHDGTLEWKSASYGIGFWQGSRSSA